MSDLTFPDDELAELASAYVDGVATADERARAEANPQVMALVAQLRSVSTVLATPVVAADALREQHLAAALAAFVTADEATARSAAARPVAARASWRQRWLMPLLGAGAATLVVAGVSIAAIGGDDAGLSNADAPATVVVAADSTVVDAVAKQAGDAESTSGGQAPVAGDVASEPATEMAAPSQTETMASVAALPATDGSVPVASTPEELPGLVAAASAADVLATRGSDPCPQVGGTLIGPLSWQGLPALLYTVPADSPGVQALAVDAATCATLASAVLPG